MRCNQNTQFKIILILGCSLTIAACHNDEGTVATTNPATVVTTSPRLDEHRRHRGEAVAAELRKFEKKNGWAVLHPAAHISEFPNTIMATMDAEINGSGFQSHIPPDLVSLRISRNYDEAVPFHINVEWPNYSVIWRIDAHRNVQHEGLIPQASTIRIFIQYRGTAIFFDIPATFSKLTIVSDQPDSPTPFSLSIKTKSMEYWYLYDKRLYGRWSKDDPAFTPKWVLTRYLSEIKPVHINVFQPVLDGLIAAGLGEKDAETLLAKTRTDMAALTDESLLQEMLKVSADDLQHIDDVPELSRQAVLLMAGKGHFSKNSALCWRFRLPHQTTYLVENTGDEWDAGYTLWTFAPNHTFMWEGVINVRRQKTVAPKFLKGIYEIIPQVDEGPNTRPVQK